MEVFLYNSTVCRLCGEENDNGTFLYSSDENSQNISELLNSYLPIKVFDDGQLPRTICPGCTIQLEATVEFITLIANGQKVIRALHQREIEYKRSVLNNGGTESDVITENYVQEVNTEKGAYQPDHPMSLQVAGLDKPRRKRGRPPKKPKTPEDLAREAAAREVQITEEQVKLDEEPNGKRKRKVPTRFMEVVQGKELEKIFIEEGVTDGEDSEPDVKPDIKPDAREAVQKVPEVIGHTDSGELVFVIKGKGRGRPKGRLRQTRQKCAICDKEFYCSGRYMSHVAQHGPVLYQCKQCSETFTTRLDFTTHQDGSGHEGQNVIPCVKMEVEERNSLAQGSEQSISTDNDMNNTISTRSLPDLNVQTDEVEDNLNTNTSTEKDVNGDKEPDESKVKEGPDPAPEKIKLKCPHCEKLFSSKQSRSLHVKAIHRGERAYLCGVCGARFAYPRALRLHAHRHRHRHAQGFACDLCGKVLNHPSSVTYHKEAEHAGHKFVCNKCGKTFKHKQLLQRHQLVHTQLRPFNCKVCNASFKTKTNLLNHQLLHSGVKKHSCHICKQRFAHKTSLTLHLRWHNGQKPFVCKECGKAFSQKGNLSEHVRIHTGEKPFQCAHCLKRFTTSSQHRLHMKRHNQAYNNDSRDGSLLVRPNQDKATPAPTPTITIVVPPATPTITTALQTAEVPTGTQTVTITNNTANTGGGVGGVGAHTCPYCARACPSRWALVKHTRRHTGEKPFLCPHCPRAFADCSNLNKHKKHIHKQTSLLAKPPAPPAPPPAPAPLVLHAGGEEAGAEERVIYVTYDVDDDDTPTYTLVQPEQTVESYKEQQSEVTLSQQVLSRVLQPQFAPAESFSIPPDHMSVTDEQGNPLHFTMQDGTQLAITSLDGQSLQVITQDGQTIPVEINEFNPHEDVQDENTIVHQLNLKSEDEPSSPVTHYYTIV